MIRRSNGGLLVLLDQGLSSLTNFLAGALIAGLLSDRGFGAFAVAFTYYLVCLGISRSWTSEPLTVLHAASDVSSQRLHTGSAASTAAGIGVVGALGSLLIAVAAVGETRAAMLGLAVCLPFVLVQDVWRFSHVMLDRAGSACLNDLLWLVLMIVPVMTLRVLDFQSVLLATLAWGLASAPSAALGARGFGWPARPVDSLSWGRHVAPLSWRYMAEFLVFYGSSYALVIVVTAAVSLEAAGGIRAAQVIMGPAMVIYVGANMFTTPRMVRVYASVPAGLIKLAVQHSIALSAVTASWLGVALLVPSRIGVRVFGASWDGGRSALPAIGLALLAAAVASGAVCGLRAMRRASPSLSARLWSALLVAGGVAIGTWYSVPGGTLAGLATASWAAPVVWWATLLGQSRHAGARG